MFTTHENWIRLECRQCKHFKSNAEMDNVKSTCKRLDHKHLRFAKKVFKGYDCGQFDTHTCSDFEPIESIGYLIEHWEEIKSQIIPYKENEVILLNVDGNPDVRFAVSAKEFYDNTFLNADGSLRWLYKYYTKQCHSSMTGYKIVYEYPDK